MELKKGDTIIWDCDEVLAMSVDYWCQYMNAFSQEHNHPVPELKRSMVNSWTYPPHFCKVCFEKCISSSDIIGSYRVRPHAAEVLSTMSKDFNNVLVTSRPTSVEGTTFEWLQRKSIRQYFDQIFVTLQPKVEIAKKIGASVIVDDNADTIASFEKADMNAVLFDTPWNQEYPAKYRVKSLKEFERLVYASIA
jgi:5'(3')-deoxyribonucleotidase